RADDPQLTCRLPGGRDPVRIVLAGPALRLPARARVLARGGPPTWVVAPRGAPAARVAALRRRGVEVLLVPGRRGRVPFGALARRRAGTPIVRAASRSCGSPVRAAHPRSRSRRPETRRAPRSSHRMLRSCAAGSGPDREGPCGRGAGAEAVGNDSPLRLRAGR